MESPVLTPKLADAAAILPVDEPGSLLRRRLLKWTKIFSAYFGTQTVTQLLGIAAGLLFIRTMAVQQFALYALATSVITFFAFATDLGSTASLIHFFHRAGLERDDFGRYVAAVLSLRRIAFVLGALVVAATLPFAALAKGFPAVDVGLATLAVIGTAGLQVVSVIRTLALRLHDRYGQSYRAELFGAGLRLLLAAGVVAAAWTHAWLALITAMAGAALTAWLARNPSTPRLDHAGVAQLGRYRRAVLRYLLPTLPSALYFSIQGPLVVWLAATFGASRNIAEVGALTRLGMLIGVFSGLTGVVFLPRLARITDDRLYRARALQFGAVQLGLASSLLVAAWALPGPLLWVLGSQYAGLDRELLLVVAGAGLTLLGGYAVSINLARSWTRWEALAVAILATFQALAVATLPMSSTIGVLTFNLLSAAVGLGLQLVVASLGFYRPRWVAWR